MLINSGKPPIKMRATPFDWATFDALPPVVRTALNEAAFKYVIPRAALPKAINAPKAYANAIRVKDAEQVRAAYADRENTQALADLGLFV